MLKNALSRNGVLNSNLSDLRVIPLDQIVVPAAEPARPLNALVEAALSQRAEVEQARINIDSNKLNLVGIKNSLKPTLQAFAELTNNALAGQLTALGAQLGTVGPLVGGYGTLLAEEFRRNYPNYSAGLSLNIPIRNRAAQSDYVTSQLELRQNELSLQKTVNQVGVDVQNAVIGLQQARARYDAADRARVLQQQTLDGDRRKYELGASTPYQVMLDQRDLATCGKLGGSGSGELYSRPDRSGSGAGDHAGC